MHVNYIFSMGGNLWGDLKMMKCVAIKVIFKSYFDKLMNYNLGLLHLCKRILNYSLKFETIWYSKK